MENIDEKNYFIEEINQNDLMSKMHKKDCKDINRIKHLLILASAITGCVSISAPVSLVGTPRGTPSSAVGLKICVITTGIKKYESITKKKKKNMVALLPKAKLNTIEDLISRALIDSYISQNEFALVNNTLRKYGDIKDAIKNLKIPTIHQRF